MMSAQPLKKRNCATRSGEPRLQLRDSSTRIWSFEIVPVVADTLAPYRLSTVRCSMYRSNSFIEYITMPPTFVTGGPPPVTLLRQLWSVKTLTPRNAAASFSRTYRFSPCA